MGPPAPNAAEAAPQKIANFQENAAREAERNRVPPEIVREIREAQPSVIQKIGEGALAIGSVAGCAPAIVCNVGTSGVCALSVSAQIAVCAFAVGSVINFVDSIGGDLEDAWDYLFGDDDGPSWAQRHVLDGITGKLRWTQLPAPLLPLIQMGGTAPFNPSAGPFEGLWTFDLAWSPATPLTVRLYDRDGWVIGWSKERVAGNWLFRRQGTEARGRFLALEPFVFYPYAIRLDAPGILSGSDLRYPQGAEIHGRKIDGAVAAPSGGGGGFGDLAGKAMIGVAVFKFARAVVGKG